MNDAPRTRLNAWEVPDIELERYFLGELPGPARHRIERALAADPGLAARLTALTQADTEARNTYPPAALAGDVRRRVLALQSASRPQQRAAWVTAAAVVAVLAVVVTRSGPGTPGPAPTGDTSVAAYERGKGADVALVVYRSSSTGAVLLADGDVASAGDVVRVGYRVARAGFGAIVSVDGRGAVTQHWPAVGARAAALEPGETVLLDGGFELDDAPRLERFFLVAATEPFDLAPVLDALRRTGGGASVEAGALGLPPSLTATTFSLRKDTRP